MSASHARPPIVTPLNLLHERQTVDMLVVLPTSNHEPRFDIAPPDRPQAAIASIVISAGLIRIELHEAEQLVLDTNLAIEQRLPPIVVAVSSDANVEPLRLFGRDWGGRLHRPLWVRRRGTAQQPIITIGAAAHGTWTLEDHECRLWWTSRQQACTLRMSVDRTRTQLILRPGAANHG